MRRRLLRSSRSAGWEERLKDGEGVLVCELAWYFAFGFFGGGEIVEN